VAKKKMAKSFKKKVVKHLKGDIRSFKKEAAEDKKLIKSLKPSKKKDPKSKPKTKAGKRDKVKKVMEEFKAGELHSGSKKGPQVKSRKQAIAIALSESGQSKKQKKSRK